MSTFFGKIVDWLKKPDSQEPVVDETEKTGGASKEAATIPVMSPPAVTAPLESEMLSDKDGQVYPPQFLVGCGQSVGQQREHNEDALFTLTTNLVSDSTHIPFGLYIVADGMGGHQHGEIASGVAIRAMANYLIRKIYMPMFSLKAERPEESLHELMQGGIQEAHNAIIKDASGGGTTMTVALILGDQLVLGHVGDSRAYAFYLDGTFKVLSRDHSLVKRLEELGQITSEEAAVHPQRNVLYRALGQGEPFEPDINIYPLLEGGFLMLCSDGLWGYVPEDKMKEIIRSASTPEFACNEMVKVANAAGGPDNITVVLVRFPA